LIISYIYYFAFAAAMLMANKDYHWLSEADPTVHRFRIYMFISGK